jgi:hypothetical protein
VEPMAPQQLSRLCVHGLIGQSAAQPVRFHR